MTSRAWREGSVGLLLLAGLGLLAGLVFWLKDMRWGRQAYEIVVEFPDAKGLKEGTPVRYRGVEIGKVTGVRPTSSTVDVIVSIMKPNLQIPSEAVVEAQSSAFLGDMFLDIQPQARIEERADRALPLDKGCDSSEIVCNNSRLEGRAIADMNDLVRSMDQVAQLLSNPKLVADIEKTADNAAKATAGVSGLTKDLSTLSRSVQGQVQPLTGNLTETLTTATTTLRAAQGTVATANRTLTTIGSRADRTLTDIGSSAAEVGTTASRARVTLSQVDQVIVANKGAIAQALTNVAGASGEAQLALKELTPTLTQVRKGDLLDNFEKLSGNLRVVSANLRIASAALNDPAGMVALQQTLDAARVTFINAQKITSDLDDITGDPKVRVNLRRLINGLGNLVSTTTRMEAPIAQMEQLNPGQGTGESVSQTISSTRSEAVTLYQDLSRLAQRIEAEDARSRSARGSSGSSHSPATPPGPPGR
jgi:phospholipid/cholesterol/gamma-HCH transport system substrate-binding protein